MLHRFNFEYIILVLFFSFLFRIDKKQIKTCEYVQTVPKYVCLIVYICFWGLRGFIGTDYSWYYPYFNELSSNFLYAFDDIERIEPGYVIYAFVFKYIWDDYHAFVCFSTCLNVMFMHYIFKKILKRYYILGFVVFVAFCANSEFNNLRNIRAILLFYLSLESVVRHDWKTYYCLNLLGLMFHSTAIFYFPLYYILNKNWRGIILPLNLIGFILVVFNANILVSLILYIGSLMGGLYEVSAFLFAENVEIHGFTFGAVARLILSVFLWLSYNNFKKPIFRVYANLVICYLFCFSFFNELPVFRLRLSLLFAFALCIILPYIYVVIQNKYKKVYLYYVCLFSLSQAMVNFQGELFRYDNLLWGIDSYEQRITQAEKVLE